MKAIIFGIAMLFQCYSTAQQACRASYNDFIFNSNNIYATFSPYGGKFGFQGGFLAPYPNQPELRAISNAAPWIGGYKNGQLRFAGLSFFTHTDFGLGPLGPDAAIQPAICPYFDTVWSVYREDIVKHRGDFFPDGIINDTLRAIFGWPAQGNQFFKRFNGFDLPGDHNGGWADFKDLNNNNIYEPHLGEYPVISLKDQEYIPDHIMWMVFNDNITHTFSNGQSLGIEIQLTVFGFNCLDNKLLNNTIFNTYKIINQGNSDIDSTYFGLWTDYDLGCDNDDFIGSDSVRSTEFVYNGDLEDEQPGYDCDSGGYSYGPYPPVISMTYLSSAMHSVIEFPLLAEGVTQFYRLLTGTWRNGTPLTYGGSGYNPGGTNRFTKFIYSGDPRDTTQWSQKEEFLEPNGRTGRTVSSVYLDKLNSQESAVIETAYMFHQDSSLNNLEQVGFMYSNVDDLITSLDELDSDCILPQLCLDYTNCVWPGDFNHNGIVDHLDLLYWGVMNQHTGSPRHGLVSWRGHYADEWSNATSEGINFKHGDADGNGIVDTKDLERYLKHFHFTNSLYTPQVHYPKGPEIIITSDPINSSGHIRRFSISTGTDLENVLGLTYELEFDTTFFVMEFMDYMWPSDSNNVMFNDDWKYYTGGNKINGKQMTYTAVKTDHQEIFIPKNTVLQEEEGIYGFKLKPGISLNYLPHSNIFRLRNLKAIDAQGNDLHIGSNQLVLLNPLTGIADLNENEISVFPNPAKDELFVNVPSEVRGQIFDAQGHLMLEALIKPHSTVNVSGLSQGIYLLRLAGFSKTFKIVIL